MRYREHPVPDDLRAIATLIWTLDTPATTPGLPAAAEPVIPDGRPEIIVHWGDVFERVSGAGAVERQAGALLAGQLTSPLLLRATGRVSMLGIRLQPAGAAALWAGSQAELAGLTPDAASVSAPLGRWLDTLRDRCPTPDAAVPFVADGLRRLARPSRIDPRVARAAAAIQRRGGDVRVEAIAAAVGMTRRHLERRFLAEVGTTPKRLARIARLQRALGALAAAAASGARRPGLEAAMIGGYADEAHFVRDCRALAGTTPAAHLAQHGEFTGAFLDH